MSLIVLRVNPPTKINRNGLPEYIYGGEQRIRAKAIPKIGDTLKLTMKDGSRCRIKVCSVHHSVSGDGSVLLDWESWIMPSGEVISAKRGRIVTVPEDD